MKGDPGYFGPQSMMWKINKEITVLFGGARALLMHAAHPLIAAGARQTSFYQRGHFTEGYFVSLHTISI